MPKGGRAVPLCSRLLLAVALLGTAPHHVFAAGCTDSQAVANARAAAEAACNQLGMGCATAPTHGQHVSCVAHQASAAVKARTLPKECKGAVKTCAARSTCRKSGFVTCCRTTATGVQTCRVERSAAACKAPRGSSACAGEMPRCCDACGGTTCPTVTTTTTATSTTVRRTTTTTTGATSTTAPTCVPTGGSCTMSTQCCSHSCYLGYCY